MCKSMTSSVSLACGTPFTCSTTMRFSQRFALFQQNHPRKPYGTYPCLIRSATQNACRRVDRAGPWKLRANAPMSRISLDDFRAPPQSQKDLEAYLPHAPACAGNGGCTQEVLPCIYVRLLAGLRWNKTAGMRETAFDFNTGKLTVA